MIHNDIQNQLQLLIKTSAPPLIEVARHIGQTPQWTPGQRLPAHVLASLPNGRFEVKVGDQVLDLNLPRNTQPGATLDLTYVSSSPRLTFALTRDLSAALPANSQVALSDAAKFLGSLLQKGAVEPGQAQQTARLAPVVIAPPAAAADFAQSLKQAVAQSGLFYESHQVQWLNGQRPLSALLQEPQGRLAPLPNASSAQTQTSAPAQPAQLQMQAQQPQAGAAKTPEINLAQTAALPAAGGEKMLTEPVHPQAVQLVQQQLQTLDTRQIIWQGQIWPGQEMHWEIEEESSHAGGDDDLEATRWQTRLNLQLPALGGINAKLAFVNGMLQLDIAAANPDSADLLRNSQKILAERLDASGLQLSGVAIRHE
jgi:hypothetical protein